MTWINKIKKTKIYIFFSGLLIGIVGIFIAFISNGKKGKIERKIDNNKKKIKKMEVKNSEINESIVNSSNTIGKLKSGKWKHKK